MGGCTPSGAAAVVVQSTPPDTAVEGDRHDFEAVYDAWFHEVSRWVRALGALSVDLDDVTQEVFVVVQRKLPGFDGAHLRAWLYRITSRTVRDWRRRAWFRRILHRREVELEDVPAAGPDPGEALERREAERTLARLLRRMSEKRRTVFVLADVEGYGCDEIAELQGVPAPTVRTRLFHARRDFARLCAARRRFEER